jgi:hypothetical protein
MQVVDTLGELEIAPNKTKIVVSVLSTTVKDKYKLDLRMWFKNFDGSWIPTRKGFTIPKDKKQELLNILLKDGNILL